MVYVESSLLPGQSWEPLFFKNKTFFLVSFSTILPYASSYISVFFLVTNLQLVVNMINLTNNVTDLLIDPSSNILKHTMKTLNPSLTRFNIYCEIIILRVALYFVDFMFS